MEQDEPIKKGSWIIGTRREIEEEKQRQIDEGHVIILPYSDYAMFNPPELDASAIIDEQLKARKK